MLVGDVVLLLLAIFGLAAVAETMGELFVLVKVAGGAYLVWLGSSCGGWSRSRSRRRREAARASGAPAWAGLR
jgi:threonine/homoserine/homoserine lactone efflux protein